MFLFGDTMAVWRDQNPSSDIDRAPVVFWILPLLHFTPQPWSGIGKSQCINMRWNRQVYYYPKLGSFRNLVLGSSGSALPRPHQVFGFQRPRARGGPAESVARRRWESGWRIALGGLFSAWPGECKMREHQWPGHEDQLTAESGKRVQDTGLLLGL